MGNRRATMVAVLLAVGLLAPAAILTGPALAAPGTPVLTGPADGATVTANPVLGWDAVPGAVRYQVQISTDMGFAGASLKFNLSTANTRATPPNDLATGTYFWRVQAFDAANQGSAPAVRTFTKTAADAPIPQLPADGGTIQYPDPVVLSWQPMAGMKEYLVQIDDDPLFVGAAAPIVTSATSYTPLTPPTLDTVQYWRVQGRSQQSVLTQFSAARSYSLTWTTAPDLVGPPSTNATTIEEVNLDWTAIAGAASYQLQISPDAEFNAPIGGTRTVDSTTFSPSPTLAAGAYFWRVRGMTTSNPAQPGPWSSTFTFTREWPAANTATRPNGTEGGAFPQVTLLSPADDDFTLTEPTFSWAPQREASHYQFQVGTDVNFSPGTFDTCTTNRTTFSPSSGANQCDPPKLNPGVVLHWRVRAVDGAVFGQFSDVRQFLYDPAVVTQLTPADGETVSVPILSWEPVPNIGRYRVTIDPADAACPNSVTDVYATVFVPETLPLTCTGAISWFVQSLEADGDPSRVVLSVADWPTFTLGALPAVQATLDPVVTTPTTGYRPPLMSWNPIATATTYRVWVSVAGANSFVRMHTSTNRTAFSYTSVGRQAPLAELLTPGDYEFFVEALNGTTSIATSTHGFFTIDPMPVTTLVSPTHCPPSTPCQVLHDTPTLDWDPVVDAGAYIVYLASDPNFTAITREWTSHFSELTPQESLPDSQAGQATYWFVRPCFTTGACGAFDSSVFPNARAFRKQSFAVQTIAPAAGFVAGAEVTFEWTDYLVTNQALDPATTTQEARNYRVQVATDAGFVNIVETSPLVDQTTYTSQTTSYPDGPLFWRVQATDQSGNNLTFSDPIEFSKSSAVPVQTAPAAGAGVNGAPVLRWDAMTHTETYEVEIYRNPGLPLAPANKVGSSILTRSTAAIPLSLLPPETYGWRIRRIDINGRAGPWSAPTNAQLRLFTVTGPAATLLSPANGAVIDSVPLLFEWLPVQGATRYRFEASTVANFTSTIETMTLDIPAFAPSLLSPVWPTGTIFWRVVTLDGGGNALATSAVRTIVNDSGTNGEFTPVQPFRVADTRVSGGAIGPNAERIFQVTGVNGSSVPASGVSAVVMNVTAVTPTATGWLTVFPANVVRPTASNLNFVAGQIVPNLVTVGVSASGQVRIHNSHGNTHVLLDIVGYYSNGTLPEGSRFSTATTPTRILDTRGGPGIAPDPLGPSETRVVEVAGLAGVPADATAVVMNVTAVTPSAGGWLTLFPAGLPEPPNASNLNFTPGVVVPNLVVVPLGVGGDVSIFNSAGTTHAIFDVVGWFQAADPPVGSRFNPVTPARLLDSRNTVIFGNGETRPLTVRGVGGVPNDAAVKAVVINVTVTGPLGSGWLTVFPAGTALPLASNLNYVAGQTVPNLVVARVGTAGQISINTHVATHVIVDVVGWYSDL